jgi:hypothetical protein
LKTESFPRVSFTLRHYRLYRLLSSLALTCSGRCCRP